MKLAGFYYQIIQADRVGVEEGEEGGECGEGNTRGEEKLNASGFHPGEMLALFHTFPDAREKGSIQAAPASSAARHSSITPL